MHVDHEGHAEQRRREIDHGDRHERRDEQTRGEDGRAVLFAHQLGFLRVTEAHGGEFEILAAEQPGGGDKEHDEACARDEHERQRDQIDQHRQQRGLAALDNGEADRQRFSGHLRRIVLAFDNVGDIVDEHAGDQRGNGRHQEHRADHDAEARGDRDDPRQNVDQRVIVGADHGLRPHFARSGEPA